MAQATSFSRRETTVAWLFVGVQFLLLAIMVFFPKDVAWSVSPLMRNVASVFTFSAIALGILGAMYLGRGLTPSPLPNGGTDLVTKGPYRWIRHPIYSAVMLLSVGMTIRGGSIIVALAFIALIALFSVKARWEEGHLAETFPGYQQYMDRTGRFLPSPGR